MIALGAAIAALIILLMCLLTFVQTLYMESLRLRTREFPAITYFKETLEDAIGAKDERGVLALSLIKHTLLVILALVFFAVSLASRGPVWQAFVEAGLFTWLAMVVFTYLVPQFLYRRTTGNWLHPLTPLLRLLVKVVSPVISLLMFLESLAELAEPERPDPQITDANENIEALISAGEEEGIIEEDDGKLIKSVVAFGDKTVREVMTPRPNIVAISIDRSLEDLRQLVIH
ncbi:MAG: CNNM domain-containing protein [Bryobacteraceae bacterium]